MKRGMRHIAFRAVCLPLWMVLTTACSKEESEPPVSTGQIAVFTSLSRSGEAGSGEEVKACLLFWREADYYPQILKGNFSATPYLVSKPNEKIDYYNVGSGVPYNTEQSYPLGDAGLYVCGFAPASLESDDNYKTLPIPREMLDGKTDFLSGDGNQDRMGKSSAPFVVDANDGYVEKNQAKQLEFCHLTSKIVVTAQRSEQMLRRIGVRNVEVMLFGQQVPTKLVWRTIDDSKKWGGYFPVEPMYLRQIHLASQFKDPLVQTMVQRVDSCYVFAGNEEHFHASGTPPVEEKGEIKMHMNISAQLIPVVNGVYDYDQAREEEWNDVEVTIQSKTGASLKMGYKYEINIIFDISGIRLQGIEMEWDEGGIHYIPITPNPDKNEENKP